MVTPSRRSLERQVRRQCVLDAARQLFADKGVENASMDDIAAAADYTRRSLYAHFRSRDEILLTVLTQDLTTRWQRQKAAVAEVGSGLLKVRRWAEVLYEYSRQNPQSLRLQIFWDLKGIDRSAISEPVFAEFLRINTELAEGLQDVFRLGIQDTSLRADLDIDTCISQFLHSLRAVINRALTPTYSFVRIEPDDYVEHFIDLFCRALANPKGGVR